MTKIIKWIKSKYGGIWAERGKFHDYLRMILDYQENFTVEIIIERYINKMLTEHNITGTA